jgi:plastocyanin
VAAALVVPACGSDDDDSGGNGNGGDSGSSETTVEITATDFEFDPPDPSVEQAGTVKFRLRNEGEAPHALEIEGPGGEAKTEQIPPGQSTTIDVDLSKAGAYEMYCPVGDHKQRGMTGEVSVGGGSGGSGDTTTEKDSGGGNSYGY